jgi:hypothetical protein
MFKIKAEELFGIKSGEYIIIDNTIIYNFFPENAEIEIKEYNG